jgi:hypothetical protein
MTNASLSVFMLKNPEILMACINPSIQSSIMALSSVWSKSTEKTARFALQVVSNIGLMGSISFTTMNSVLIVFLLLRLARDLSTNLYPSVMKRSYLRLKEVAKIASCFRRASSSSAKVKGSLSIV